MKRIVRDRLLTPEEADKYNKVREQVAQELPDLIVRHHDRMDSKDNSEPAPFNPEFRKGFGEALSAEYTEWSNQHPDHTKEEGQAAHKEIAARLLPLYPSIAELSKK